MSWGTAFILGVAVFGLVAPGCSAPELAPNNGAPDDPALSDGADGGDAGAGSKTDASPPKPVVPQKDIPVIDQAVAKLMSDHAVPGVSIAITRNEKLVYAKAYGKMSANDAEPVTNGSLYRIASISKTFTSVGIMRLVEQGKLTLDRKVFGAGGVLAGDYSSANLAAMSDITIDHLLHHTSGNWANYVSTDPMYKQPQMSASQLIQWTLDNYPDQGKRGQYQYSNFGFFLLGRVIEKISGKTYEQFMRDEVLAPVGITDMTIAGNTLAERKPNEVLYNTTERDPYGDNIRRMDANGGWIASAIDLMRFAVRVDGFAAKPDLLAPSTMKTMLTPSAANANYACGWSVNNINNWWHTGLLFGSTSEIVRANEGFNWAILLNRGEPNDDSVSLDMDQLLWPIVRDTSTPWQDIDQF